MARQSVGDAGYQIAADHDVDVFGETADEIPTLRQAGAALEDHVVPVDRRISRRDAEQRHFPARSYQFKRVPYARTTT